MIERTAAICYLAATLRTLASCFAVSWALAGAAWGQDGGADTAAPPDPPPAKDDAPPAPRSDDFDWLQFKNGEWLKGEIKDLQDDSLTFDSDKLDELSLDFDDLEGLFSSKVNTLRFEDKTIVEGPFRIEGDTVTVMTADGERTFPRDTLRGIIPGRMTELNFWSGKLSVGGTIRQGNVNQTDLSMSFRVQRRSPGKRLLIEYNGAYGTVEGVKTANNHRFFFNNDIFFSRDLFVRVPSFEYFKDEFQNIEYRLTPGILVGYDIIDRNRLKWTVSGGPGYQVTKFFEPLAGTPGRTEDGVLLFATDAQWEATTKIDLYGEYTLAVPVSGNNNNMRLTLGTDIEVWGNLDFDIKFILDFQSNPARLSDGSLPENSDVRIFFGLGWDF